jgi:AraC-like DNA-binding protein
VSLVVSLGDPLDLVRMPDPSQPPDRLQAAIGGLQDRPLLIRHDGSQFGVQIELRPDGIAAILGLPAAELAGSVVDVAAVLGPLGGELTGRLDEAPTWAARFAAVDALLVRRLRSMSAPPLPSPEVRRAWSRLVATGGRAGVADLADEVGWSRRHLSERFRREYGLTPKSMSRVLRFERARWMLSRQPTPSLADVAVRAGYFDQSHLTREWNRLAGDSPASWLAAEQLPFVQDGATADGGE